MRYIQAFPRQEEIISRHYRLTYPIGKVESYLEDFFFRIRTLGISFVSFTEKFLVSC